MGANLNPDDNTNETDLTNPSKLSDSAPVQPHSAYDPSPLRNFSVYTAASESDLRHNANSFYVSNNQGSNDIQDRLEYYYWRIKLYSMFGCVCLTLMSITFLILRNYLPSFVIFILVIALALCSIFGCRNKDWRLILGVFILSFVLLAYLAARGVLAIVLTVARAYMSDEDITALGFGSRGLMIASGVVEFLLCLFFAIYWGLNGYYSEKIVRILLEYSAQCHQEQQGSLPHQHRNANNQFNRPHSGEVRVVGNPVYFSTGENPQHTSVNVIDVPPVPNINNRISTTPTNDGPNDALPTHHTTNNRQATEQSIHDDSSRVLTFDRLPPPSSPKD